MGSDRQNLPSAFIALDSSEQILRDGIAVGDTSDDLSY